MIFQIDQSFYDRISSPIRSQLYSDIIYHGHYVDCPPRLRQKFYEDIDVNGSSLQKDMVRNDPSLRLPTMFRQYLTTIDLNTVDCKQLDVLINKPALLIVENEVNEKDVIKDIINKYAKQDKSFKSLFEKLEETLNNEDIEFDQAGGCTQLAPLYQSHDKSKYHHAANWKICLLADRDTDNPMAVMDNNKQSLIAFACGKDPNTVTEADIYELNQNPVIWHVWYYREIENYFPAKQFRAIGLDPDCAGDNNPDWHFKDLGTIPGYDKTNLSKLTKGMSYGDYEEGLKRFPPGKEEISEMQLFLLKLVRII